MSETGQETEKRGPGRPPQAKNRPTRIPMGERGRLVYDPQLVSDLKAQGLNPRLITDHPGRIDAAVRAGYRFVQSDGKIGDDRAAAPERVGGNLTTHVGKDQVGYLMVLPKDWYDEDQRKKLEKVDASEEAMKAPKKGAKLASDAEGTAYGPGLTND